MARPKPVGGGVPQRFTDVHLWVVSDMAAESVVDARRVIAVMAALQDASKALHHIHIPTPPNHPCPRTKLSSPRDRQSNPRSTVASLPK